MQADGTGGRVAFTIGIDYGTNSVRAVVVDCADGHIVGTSVFNYPSGDRGVLLQAGDPHLARQLPGDYIAGLEASVTGALTQAEAAGGFSRTQVIGIGVDTTGSTPLPVDAQARPLALDPRWADNLAAHAWLWKDHTSADEASATTETARRHAPRDLWEPVDCRPGCRRGGASGGDEVHRRIGPDVAGRRGGGETN